MNQIEALTRDLKGNKITRADRQAAKKDLKKLLAEAALDFLPALILELEQEFDPQKQDVVYKKYKYLDHDYYISLRRVHAHESKGLIGYSYKQTPGIYLQVGCILPRRQNKSIVLWRFQRIPLKNASLDIWLKSPWQKKKLFYTKAAKALSSRLDQTC